MYNFPAHLRCVATLPENTTADQIDTFSCGWVTERSWMTTDEFQWAMKFKVRTAVPVANLAD